MKYAVACYPRTGSSLIIGTLHCHPKVFNRGEVYHGKNLPAISDPIKHLYQEWELHKEHGRKKDAVTHFGFKIFSDHCRKPPFDAIWSHMQEEKFHIILLTRKNLLNRYLSHLLVLNHAECENNGWGNVEFFRPVEIDPQACIKNIKIYLGKEDWLRTVFLANPVFEVAYEDLMESYPRILDFLELEYHPPQWKMTKQRTKTQQEMIKNYWELKKALEGTPYIKYFDEEETCSML
jgi:hypothetical protein